MGKRKTRKTYEPFELHIERLHEDGQGLGIRNGRNVLVWGAFPGERAMVMPRKKRRGFLLAELLEVLEPSPHRCKPIEEHYLSCSPWQALEPAIEHEYKLSISREIFRKRGGIELPENTELFEGRKRLGYRNKMEFSFTSDDGGKLSLALHRRVVRRKRPVNGCVLASAELNTAALGILEELRRQNVTEGQLKTVIIRSSSPGRTSAALFVTARDIVFSPEKLNVPNLEGFSLYYSDPELSASVPTELIARTGSETLIEELSVPDGKGQKVQLTTGVLNFYQVNVEAFEMALRDMAPFVEGDDIVEYFSGVGAISIGLSGSGRIGRMLLVDIDPGAIAHARENIRANGLEGRYEAVAETARRMREEITPERLVIFDPPRSGLEPKVLKRIIEVLPPRIVYLSCNTKTQADDIGALREHYSIRFSRLYNFFPRTPHVESLIVLERAG